MDGSVIWWIAGGAVVVGLVLRIFIAPRLPNWHPAYRTTIKYLQEKPVLRERLGLKLTFRELPLPMSHGMGGMGHGAVRYMLEVTGTEGHGTVEVVLVMEPESLGERWEVSQANLVKLADEEVDVDLRRSEKGG
jgi:hypothetical protein